MTRRRRYLLAVVVLGVLSATASPALGEGSPAWPVSQPRVLLGFGESYRCADGTRVHRGIDIAATEGEEVSSASEGTVAFAGRVPGDGSMIWAVSVVRPDGSRLTYQPLDQVRVEAGEVLSSGEPIGVVAAAGDPSSAGPHLHLGLRNGSAYLDPLSVLTPPAPPAQPEPEADPEPEPSQAPAPSKAVAPAPAMEAPEAQTVPRPAGPVSIPAPSSGVAVVQDPTKLDLVRDEESVVQESLSPAPAADAVGDVGVSSPRSFRSPDAVSGPERSRSLREGLPRESNRDSRSAVGGSLARALGRMGRVPQGSHLAVAGLAAALAWLGLKRQDRARRGHVILAVRGGEVSG